MVHGDVLKLFGLTVPFKYFECSPITLYQLLFVGFECNFEIFSLNEKSRMITY